LRICLDLDLDRKQTRLPRLQSNMVLAINERLMEQDQQQTPEKSQAYTRLGQMAHGCHTRLDESICFFHDSRETSITPRNTPAIENRRIQRVSAKLNLVPYILCKTPGCLCPILKTQMKPKRRPKHRKSSQGRRYVQSLYCMVCKQKG
jgi:hypothetical protein